MKTIASVLFGLSLAGLTLNVYALCVNPDGTLDDPSMSPGSIAMDMVPSCDNASTSAANKQPATTKNDDAKSDKTASVASKHTNPPQGQ